MSFRIPFVEELFLSPRPQSLYPLRPAPLGFSVAVHAVLLALVALGPSTSSSERRPPSLYATVIVPNEKKLIWYRLQDKLPAVSPSTERTQLTLKGAVRSPTVIRADPPRPRRGTQFIWQAAPKLHLDQDLKTPNLIAVEAPARPQAQPPRPAPKTFHLPSDRPFASEPRPFLEFTAPLPQSNVDLAASGAPSLAAVARPKPRAFTSPGPTVSSIKPVIALDPAEPLSPSGLHEADAAASTLATVRRPAPRVFIPPPPQSATHGTGQGSGSSAALDSTAFAPTVPSNLSGTAAAAVIGLRPASRPDAPPPAFSNPVRLSAGPQPGSGRPGGTGDGVVIPGLTVEGAPTNTSAASAGFGAPPEVTPPPGGSLYVEYFFETSLLQSSPGLSAPLRPSSRTIPRELEPRFTGRNVYTLVVPMPNVRNYAGDWILWFADREPQPGEPSLRAPIPVRRIERSGSPPDVPGLGRVQLAATIRLDGRLESVTVLRSPTPGLGARAVEDFRKWEFRPAIRNGAPISVDVVVEIPFQFGVQTSRQ